MHFGPLRISGSAIWSLAAADASRPETSPTSIFSPVSTPARSIFDLSIFVLVMTAIFVDDQSRFPRKTVSV